MDPLASLARTRRTAAHHQGTVIRLTVEATGESFSRPTHHKKGTKPRRIRTALPDETPVPE
ncbi:MULTISPECIES: hypothetical protein [unclassified Streptomyces]|uniref:hypothetical protein n=1 Tax=unclassified Streptomyces TaxID=2593676 RepID=UPI0030773B4F